MSRNNSARRYYDEFVKLPSDTLTPLKFIAYRNGERIMEDATWAALHVVEAKETLAEAKRQLSAYDTLEASSSARRRGALYARLQVSLATDELGVAVAEAKARLWIHEEGAFEDPTYIDRIVARLEADADLLMERHASFRTLAAEDASQGEQCKYLLVTAMAKAVEFNMREHFRSTRLEALMGRSPTEPEIAAIRKAQDLERHRDRAAQEG